MADSQTPAVPLDDATMIERGTAVLAANVGEQVVMMDVKSGRYLGLDDIGTDIWRRLETPLTFGELIDGLAADYDAERAVIAEDVRQLLAKMAAHQAVHFAMKDAAR